MNRRDLEIQSLIKIYNAKIKYLEESLTVFNGKNRELEMTTKTSIILNREFVRELENL